MASDISSPLALAVSAMLGGQEFHLERGGIGGNNQLYRVEDLDGRCYALKSYFDDAHDPRDRIGTECKALAFAWAHGLRSIPRLIDSDRAAGCVLFEWIDGSSIETPRDGDIDNAIDFLAELKCLAGRPGAELLPAASEACFAGDEICRQISERQKRLAACHDGRLASYLGDRFAPTYDRSETIARGGYETLGLNFDTEIRPQYRTLSPSDFGFHNALRRRDGKVIFIDFEFFGWDDPVKLTADFLLHPGMVLGRDQKSRLLQQCTQLFKDDPTFGDRLKLLYPLFGLRWCLILLNRFLPEKWERLAHANACSDRDLVCSHQLEKAQRMLAHVAEMDGNLFNVA